MTEGTIIIRKGREKPIRNQHPWIFSGAIAHAENANPGDIVTVRAHDGQFLGRGYWNPQSQIQVRILTWQDEPITDDWWRAMLRRAIEGRGLRHVRRQEGEQLAYRMVNAENDFLPGLIVDNYGDWLVIQALTLGIDRRKSLLVDLLVELLQPKGVYERSDVDVRGKEGLESVKGLLWGEEPPDQIVIEDLAVDVRNGHKTGAYLDQRDNYVVFSNLMSADYAGEFRLLNLFSYTGSFGLYALEMGGGHVVNVDSSLEALQIGEVNYQRYDFAQGQHGESYEFVQADVFDYLRRCVKQNDLFDIVILDPPKFAHSKQQVDKASRGYKDLNLNAFKIIQPGGYLMTFSCSGAISPDLFQKIVFGALADSGRQAQILRHLGPGVDHPVALTFPEGAYLKGLLLRVY